MLRNSTKSQGVGLVGLLCSSLIIPALLWYVSVAYSLDDDDQSQHAWRTIIADPQAARFDWPKYSSPHTASHPVLWLGLDPGITVTPMATLAFRTFGYKVLRQYSEPSKWDVYWGKTGRILTLFGEKKFLNTLGPRQKVNKVPGYGQLMLKEKMVTHRDVSSIPPAFKIPGEKQEFFSYVKSHPDSLWLQKGALHRGLRIVKPSRVSFDAKDVFLQQFIHNPFLVDGRKSNMGVFAGMTSSEPTRMYIYLHNFFLKFCRLPYHPFNANKRTKYIDTGNYTLAKDMPSLSKMFYKDGMNAKMCFTTHIHKTRGLPTALFDERLVDVITEVIVKREANISSQAKRYKLNDYSHFFHFYRMDLLLDADLRIWFIEANSGPDSPRDVAVWMEAVEDFLRMAGVSIPVGRDDFKKEVPDSEIEVNGPSCQTAKCKDNCGHWECRVCSQCLTEHDREDLRRAVFENRRQRAWRRVMPPPLKSPEKAREWNPEKDPDYLRLSDRTRFTALWYHRKCIQNAAFCN